MLKTVKNYLLSLQNEICQALEKEENQQHKFHEDSWERSLGGGGKTRVLSNGNIFAKAGVNFSHVYGDRLPRAASAKRANLAQSSFNAVGLSLVIHPENPYVPTAHANLRFFVAEVPGSQPLWWFGGGFDLTPCYGFIEDCQHWHQSAHAACKPFGKAIYAKYKKWCDEYFYLKHRNEPRGIGGIFFDDLNEWDFPTCFAFCQSVGDHFLPAYLPILQRRKRLPYGEREKIFQKIRRSRYVEFNLIYDRGTLFGLQSGARVESILMSLPPEAAWQYNWQGEPGSLEARFYEEFLEPRDWV